MTRRRGAPMPASLRPARHPALAVGCRHCDAGAGTACRNRRHTKTRTDPHPSRITALVIATAVCPTCQVEPGVPCHNNGRAIDGHHQARETAARRTT